MTHESFIKFRKISSKNSEWPLDNGNCDTEIQTVKFAQEIEQSIKQ